MVYNHGARQLDLAPSRSRCCPAIRDAVDDKMTVMFDGGTSAAASACRCRQVLKR